MAAKLTRLTHKIAIQLHLVAESCTIYSSRSGQPVQKFLDTLSYLIIFETDFEILLKLTQICMRIIMEIVLL
jgi:hypothetical protein